MFSSAFRRSFQKAFASPDAVAAPAFAPTDLAGLTLWLKADGTLWQDSARTTPVTSNADPVGSWDDASGSGHHLLQAVGAGFRPTYRTNIKNGLPSILFDGVNHFLKAAAFTLNQPFHVFLVFRQVTWTYPAYIFDGNTAASAIVFQNPSTPSLTMYAGAAAPTLSTLAVNTFGIIDAVFNGAGSLIRLNNGTPVTGNPGVAGPGGFTLGSDANAGNISNIEVIEVAVYTAEITGTNLTNLYAYLNGRAAIY